MVRVPLRPKSDLPEEYRYLLDEDALGPRNIFRAMGHNPEILESYMHWGTTLWRESGFEERTIELAILAVARACRSEYEWQTHVELGLDAGVTPAEIRAIGRDDSDPFDEADRLIVEYVQAVALEEVDDTLAGRVTDRFSRAQTVGLTMLASHYLMTARMLSALAVPTEDAFVGWEPEDLERA